MAFLFICILSAIAVALSVVSRSARGMRTWASAIGTAAVFLASIALARGIGWWSMVILLGDIAVVLVLMRCGAERLSLRSAIKLSYESLASVTVVLIAFVFVICSSGLAEASTPVVLDQMGMFFTSLAVISATSLVAFDHHQAPSLSDHQGTDHVQQLWSVWRRLICTGVLAVLAIGGYSSTMLGEPNWAEVFTAPVVVATAAPIAGILIGLLVLRVDRGAIARPERRVGTRMVIWGVCLANILIWFLLPRAGLENLTPISWSAIVPLVAGAFLLIPADYWGNVLLNDWKYRFRDVSVAISIGLATSSFVFTHIGVRYATVNGPDVELIYQHCIVAVVQLASFVWTARALGTLAAADQEPKRMPSTLAQSMAQDALMYTWLLAAAVVGISTKLTPGPKSNPIANLIIVAAVAGVVIVSWKSHIAHQRIRTSAETWHEDYITGLTWQRRGQLFAVLLTAIPAGGAAIFGASS